MKVSIVIPAWNARTHLETTLAALDEIRRAPPVEFEVVVVDNGSKDKTDELVRERFPWMTLIRNERNNGFGGANNQGYRAGRGEYVLLLNADARLNAAALKGMSDFLDAHPRAAQVGVRQVFEDGTFQPTCRRLPTLWDDFCEMSLLRVVFPRSALFNRWRMNDWAHDRTMRVDQPMASCLLVRRRATEATGLFDEDYWPIYYEDVDLAARLKKAGWESWFLAEAKIVHVGSITYREAPTRSIEWWTRGKFIYFKKHGAPWATAVLSFNLGLRGFLVKGLLPALRRLTGRPRDLDFLRRELEAMREGRRKFRTGEAIKAD